MSLQMDFFSEELSDTELLRLEMKELKESQDKLRKGLFSRHGELGKMIMSQQAQIDMLRSQVIR